MKFMNTWSWVLAYWNFLHKLRYIHRTCVWVSSCWSWWPRKVARIRGVEYEEENRSRETWKRDDWWFHHTDMINLFYQNLTFPLGVSICLDMFPQKNIFHGLLSLIDSRVIGKRYLKFSFDIRELPYKLRIGKKPNQQNNISASLSGRLSCSF